jgi:hypothetical protein
MRKPVYRNGRIWCVHTTATPLNNADRSIVLWYELDPLAMPNPIVQGGAIDNGPGTYLYFPSIAANAAGDVCIGFSRSDDGHYAEGAYATRQVNDPQNMMSSVKTLKCGDSVDESMMDLSDRMRIYTAHIPKQTQWHTELIFSDLGSRLGKSDFIRDVSSIQELNQELKAAFANAPEFVAEERAVVLRELDLQFARLPNCWGKTG